MIQNSFEDIELTRITGRFIAEDFLDNYNKKFGSTLGLINIDRNENNYTSKLHEACWNALFNQKDYYKQLNDWKNYNYTYLTMSNFLTQESVYPQIKRDDFRKKEFHVLLMKKINEISTNTLETNITLKWSHIHVGMLLLNYLKQFPKSTNRDQYIAMAYKEFCDAKKLETTKTVYLLLAEVIIDFGYVPEGLDREQAAQLAEGFILKSQEPSDRNPYKRKTPERNDNNKKDLPEAYARPRYIREIKDCPNSPQYKPVDKIIDEDKPVEEIVIEEYSLDRLLCTTDELLDFDFTQLDIPTCSHINLPIRQRVLNRSGVPQETYSIDGKKFRRQNVSSDGMRCFFNSAGLEPDEQICLLATLGNDATIRCMIANEIIGSLANPDQIPHEVKDIIKFDQYQTQRQNLDNLHNQRGILLKRQNSNTRLQNSDLLPEEYKNLHQKEIQLTEDLRKRALSLEAYNAYIKYHIQNEEMLVSLRDVRDNGNNNYTSIDAIAYANNIGIKIYHQGDDLELDLYHEYIPIDATEVVYIFHEGSHFQGLILINEDDKIEEEIIENSDLDEEDYEDIENKDGTTFSPIGTYSKDSLVKLSNVDRDFIKQFSQKLECLDVNLNDPSDCDFIRSDQEIRELIDFHYGEGTNLHLWINDSEPMVIYSWDEYPEELHLVSIKNKWYRLLQKPSIDQLPSTNKLKELYPGVVNPPEKSHNLDLIRQILFASEKLKYSQETISQFTQLDSRRVSEILLANGIRHLHYATTEKKEIIIQAFLESYNDIETKKVMMKDLHQALAKKLGLEKKVVNNLMVHNFSFQKRSEIQEISNQQIEIIVTMYQKGITFHEINEKTNINFITIVKTIFEYVDPKDYKNPVNLILKKKDLSEEDKEKLILNTFKNLKNIGNGIAPSINKVTKELKPKGIGYKTVERILKLNKIVPENIKSKHLSAETIKKIEKAFSDLNPRNGEVKATYSKLAERFGVTYGQVVDAIKGHTFKSGSSRVTAMNIREKVKAVYQRLTDEQKTYAAKYIAPEVGLSETAVRNHLKRLGLFDKL